MTKLSAALPGGDGNGLTAIARTLVESPHTVHVVIGLVDCKSTSVDHDTGETVPTARIRRVEVVHGVDMDTAQQIMRRALEQRTGQTVLPLDLENDLREAFGNVDPATGEILDGPTDERGGESR